MSVLLLASLALAARPRWEPQSSVTESYNIAIMALNDDRPADALTLLASVLQADPGCGLCQQALAIALLRSGAPTEALQVVEALSIPHDRSEVHTLRAVTAATIGEHEVARNAGMRAVNQDPESMAAQRALLSAHIALGDLTEAWRALANARKHLDAPEADCLGVEYTLAMNHLSGAKGAMKRCLAAADPLLIQEMELRIAHQEGDLEALSRHASALGLATLAQKAQAASMLRDGDVEAATAHLDAVLLAEPDDIDALLLRARCHQARGDINAGLIDLDQIQSLPDAPRLFADGSLRQLHSPEQLRAHASALRIMLLLDADRTEEARIILNRHGVNNVTAAASIRLQLEERGAEAAAAELEQLVQRWPNAPQLPQVALQVAAEVPPSHALIGWVQSLPYREHTLRMAELQHHRGFNESCLMLLKPLSDPDSLVLAHRCAVSDGALAEADRLLEALKEAETTPRDEALMRHAWLLGEASEPAQALALLEQIEPAEAQATTHRSLQVWLFVDTGALQHAKDTAQEGPIEPMHRAHLARALYGAGFSHQARDQMAQACEGMPEVEKHRCRDAVEMMEETP